MSNMPVPPEKPKNSNREILVLIGVIAVLCLVAIGIASYLGLTVLKNNIQDMVVKAATQTQDAYSAQATATHDAGVNDRAAFEFIEPFNDNRNLWDTLVFDDNFLTGQTTIANGMYVWSIQKAKQGFILSGGRNGNQLDLTDFDVYVDAKRAQGSQSGACYGLEFRASLIRQVASYYIDEVCDNSYFTVLYHDGATNDWTTLYTWTRSDAIRPNDWNTIGVSARGTHFTFTINDWTVVELNDASQKSGDVRLMVDIQGGETAVIWFDNFALQPR